MRIAWFTPWPPQRSGIAGRSAELVPLLAARGHGIDVYVHEGRVPVDRRAPDTPVEAGATRVLGAHDFVWRHGRRPYDLPVYQVGNSTLHDFIWPYLTRWPGLAILHDARLHHARGRALLSRGRVDAYREEFAWSHPGVSPDAAELGVLGLGGTYLYAWPMTRAVLATSRMVAVHARGAIDELASVEPSAIIEYVALGEGRLRPWTDTERAGARRSLGLSDDRVVFGIFGGLTEEKRVPQALRALAVVARRHPQVLLLLAGATEASLDVMRSAGELGIAGSVRVLPAPDDDGFDRAIAAVDVSLNLRWPSALETSGPWLRALAAARATVIVDLPHTANLATLDPRTWRLHAPAPRGRSDDDAIAVAIDILDEDHSFALAMSRLASDPDLRRMLGQNARRHWESAHTVTHMVDDVHHAVERAASLPEPARPIPASLRPDPFALARRLVAPFGVGAIGTIASLARGAHAAGAAEPGR